MKRSLKSLYLNITDRCNLNCKHCFNRSYHHLGDMPYDMIFKAIQDFVSMGGDELFFTGGEPMLYPDFATAFQEVCDRYPHLGFLILSNGTMVTEQIVELFKKNPKIKLQISLDGATAETHDEQRGRGAFKKVVQSLELLKEIDSNRIMFRMAISRINYHEVQKMLYLSMQYHHVPSFLYVMNLGNAKRNWKDISLDVNEKIACSHIIAQFYEKYVPEARPPYPQYGCPFCSEDQEGMGINIKADGAIIICSSMEDLPIGNIQQDRLADAFFSEDYDKMMNIARERKKRLEQGVCASCPIVFKCGQGCMGNAYNYGDIYGLDGDCEYKIAHRLSDIIKKSRLQES